MPNQKELYEKVKKSVNKQLSKRIQHKVDNYIEIISSDIVNEIAEENHSMDFSQQYIDNKVKKYIQNMIRQQTVIPDEINEMDINAIIYKLNQSIESIDISEDDSRVLVYHISHLIELCFEYMVQVKVMEEVLYQDKSRAKTQLLKQEIEKKMDYLKSGYEFMDEDDDFTPVINKNKKGDIINFPFQSTKKSHP